MDFEKMANTIVIHWRETRPRDSAEADAQLCTAIATALRAAATVPPKMVRVGVEDLKALGDLVTTEDGAVVASAFTEVFAIHPKTLKAYPTNLYNAGYCRKLYSTREAAESAARDAIGGG